MKSFLTALTVVILASMPVMAEDDVFKCSGQYDRYDDTCYFENGTFKHFDYADGARKVLNKEEKYYGNYYYWYGGYPYGYYPYYPYPYPYYYAPRFRGRGYPRYYRGRGRRYRR